MAIVVRDYHRRGIFWVLSEAVVIALWSLRVWRCRTQGLPVYFGFGRCLVLIAVLVSGRCSCAMLAVAVDLVDLIDFVVVACRHCQSLLGCEEVRAAAVAPRYSSSSWVVVKMMRCGEGVGMEGVGERRLRRRGQSRDMPPERVLESVNRVCCWRDAAQREIQLRLEIATMAGESNERPPE
jgi:hypothetical protein